MKPAASDRALGDLVNREAVRDCVYRSALGNDTCDSDLWKSVYWPDGTEDHGNYCGNAHTFVDVMSPAITTAMDATWHHVSNVIIRMVGTEHALAHSYALVYCRMVGKSADRWDLLAGVRYLDRFEKRDGEWRIFARVTKTDWMRESTDSFDWSRPDPYTGKPWPLGMRGTDDPLRGLFPDGDLGPLRTGLRTIE